MNLKFSAYFDNEIHRTPSPKANFGEKAAIETGSK